EARRRPRGGAVKVKRLDGTHASEPTGWVGRVMLRREDRTLLTGRGRFVDDLGAAGALHLLLARSPHAHARIRSLDTAGARRAPTVAWRHGDPDRAFRDAAHRVTLTVQQQRLCGVPMEPRGALARWDPDTGELTVWTSTQAPFRIRSSLARMLGLDEARVR